MHVQLLQKSSTVIKTPFMHGEIKSHIGEGGRHFRSRASYAHVLDDYLKRRASGYCFLHKKFVFVSLKAIKTLLVVKGTKQRFVQSLYGKNRIKIPFI